VDERDRDPLAVLRRWEDSGGTWRVVVRSPERLVVELLSCDAGEVMDRVVVAPPGGALGTYVAEHDPAGQS
jgi:hypothetical protein